MAKKNLINVACSSTIEVFRHAKDWLSSRNGIADYSASGLGWTVHDSYFAGSDEDNPSVGDWVVLKSVGEDGTRDLYCRLLCSTLANSIVRLSAGLYWNASTNAWVKPLASGSDIPHGPTTGSSFNIYIYGSLDHFFIIIGNGSNLYGRFFGKLADEPYDTTVAVTTGAVTAGTNKVVTVDSIPSSWAVGKAVYIADTANIEKASISAISGNDVTLASIAYGYGSGAKLAMDYAVCLSYNNNCIYQIYSQINHNGTVAPGTPLLGTWNGTTIAAANPDALNSDHVAESIKVVGDGSTFKDYRGRVPGILIVSATGITSGNVYQDLAGNSWRALLLTDSGSKMMLFEEV